MGKNSEKRQRVAIEAFSKRAGLEFVKRFYDPAVSGADPIEVRPGFSALLDRIEGNGVRTVVVGYSNKQGLPLSASCIKSMIDGPTPSVARTVA